MNINEGLIEWYRAHRRDLPWRRTKDPYRIWLSEVILQQTRVEQGGRYYEAFLERFPTVHHLAQATEEEVMKLWQGLGYYNRARNLHRTARHISQNRNGEFPEGFEALRGLNGVGPYTAAAIASFAFGQKEVVVDGNVERFIARLFGIEEAVNSAAGKRKVHEQAEKLMEGTDPAEFDQALMEFGALHCTPKTPSCESCPFQAECVAYREEKVDQLPVKRKGRKARDRYFNYLYLRNDEGTVLEKRTGKDIWQNLYQLPLIESERPIEATELSKGQLPKPPFREKERSVEFLAEYRHILSHQRIHARFWQARIPERNWPESWTLVSDDGIGEYAFPKLIERFLNKFSFLG